MYRIVTLGLFAATLAAAGTGRAADKEREPMIGHMVYFTLTDNSPEKVQELVAACDKYLTNHPGTAFYAAGPRGTAFDREVNDRDWDVGLHLVFKTKADHDRYQDDPRHKKFIAEQKANWKKVRVFDSLLRAR
jgi:hypothetical protein